MKKLFVFGLLIVFMLTTQAWALTYPPPGYPTTAMPAFLVDVSGNILSGMVTNYSTAAQTPAATTRTYILGSSVYLPGKLKIGTTFRWRFNITKTAAGTAASTFDIAFGTAGTTADTAQVSFTKPVGTAVIDEGWIEITAVVRGPLSASGVVAGEFIMHHNLAGTGHATIPLVVVNTISGTFDVTVPTYIGICITSGTADAITIQMVTAEACNI
jgi:hypothetical protein